MLSLLIKAAQLRAALVNRTVPQGPGNSRVRSAIYLQAD